MTEARRATIVTMSVLLAFWGDQSAWGQSVPALPKKMENRTINGGGTASVGVVPVKPQSTVRTVTYIALGDVRQWKSSDGRTILGKLIAFEDLVVEIKAEPGTQPAPAAPPTLPAHPTVVREGTARLLVDKKPFVVALDRLSEEDQKLIGTISAALAAKK